MESDPEERADVEALAERWPRALIEQGEAEGLANRWERSRRAAVRAGLPPFARHGLTPSLVGLLVEARRSRRLVRGLEAAEASIEAQIVGVRSREGGPSQGRRRISRLLLVSEDGSARFYRNIEGLIRRSEATLEVLVLVCDELALGRAVFGPEERARALLLDHKDAVVRVLLGLDAFYEGSAGAD
jgi:hypothetical protein